MQQLQRRLSPLNVWSLALGCIIGWGAFVMPGNTFLPKAGPLGTAIGMGVAALVMIVISFNYDYMIGKHPVAGGEFTYAQQTFGQRNGFFCAWFLGLSYLAIVQLNATALSLIGRNLLNNVFQVGFHYNVAGYDIYAGEVALALAALLVFGLLSIRGVRFSGVFQTVLALALVAGVFVVSAAALASDKASLANLRPAFQPDNGKLAGVLAVLAVAPWAFVGFDTVPQAAEEFNFSSAKTKVIMVVSILFGGFVYIALNTVTASVLPDGYASWTGYIAEFKNQSGLVALPTFHAAKRLLGTPGLVVIGIAVLAALLSGIVGFYMATSRLFYSLAKENVLPGWFGDLHPRYQTPAKALLFIMGVSMIAPFFGREALGWIVDMSSIGAAIGYGYTSAAALVHAARERRPGLVFTGALGLVMSLAFCVLLLVPIPGLGCSLGKESLVSLGVWCVLGLVFYLCRNKPKAPSGSLSPH